MKEVKITVLKMALDSELVEEYGIEGLIACLMHKAGEFFMPITQNPMAFVTKHGKPSINMNFCKFLEKR